MCLKKFGKQFLENCLDNELCEVEILFLLCRTVVMVMISIHTTDVSFVRFVPNTQERTHVLLDEGIVGERYCPPA